MKIYNSKLSSAFALVITLCIYPLLGFTAEITREQAVQAILNYEAKARLKEFKLNEQKMFMEAPGSNWAIAAGQLAGKDATHSITQEIVNNSLSLSFPVGPAGGYDPKIALYDALKQYIATKDPKDLGAINMANLLQKHAITIEEAQKIINVIINPFPIPVDMSVLSGVGGLSAIGEEELGERLAEQAFLSVPYNALGELAAKRIRQKQDNGVEISLMEIMKHQSEYRFKNEDDWYARIGTSSQEALLRELNHMFAFQLQLQYQQYRLGEQQVSLLATLSATQAKLIKTLNEVAAAFNVAATKFDEIDTSGLDNLD